MKLGFLDSGVGGITVLNEAMKLFKNEADYLYYADTANVPYGTKSKDAVKGYILDAVNFISSKRIDALVVACNTATSIAIEELRRVYNFPVLGMEPAVKPAVERCGNRRVLVFATPLTLKEDKFQELAVRVDSRHIVDKLPLPGLVEFAEEFMFDGKRVTDYLNSELSQFDMSRYGAVVLGCTHFNFFRPVIRKILPQHVDIIDGNLGTVMHLKSTIEKQKLEFKNGSGRIEFYSSRMDYDVVQQLSKYIDYLQSFKV